jgi:hypothetical protein
MADFTSRLPTQYRAPRRAGPPPIVMDLHVDELAGDVAGPFSPFGQDVELPLPLDRINYVHPGLADRPHLAGEQA